MSAGGFGVLAAGFVAPTVLVAAPALDEPSPEAAGPGVVLPRPDGLSAGVTAGDVADWDCERSLVVAGGFERVAMYTIRKVSRIPPATIRIVLNAGGKMGSAAATGPVCSLDRFCSPSSSRTLIFCQPRLSSSLPLCFFLLQPRLLGCLSALLFLTQPQPRRFSETGLLRRSLSPLLFLLQPHFSRSFLRLLFLSCAFLLHSFTAGGSGHHQQGRAGSDIHPSSRASRRLPSNQGGVAPLRQSGLFLSLFAVSVVAGAGWLSSGTADLPRPQQSPADVRRPCCRAIPEMPQSSRF